MIFNCFNNQGFTFQKLFLGTHFGGAYQFPFAFDYPDDFDLVGALATYNKGGLVDPCDNGCTFLSMVGYTGRSEDDNTLFPVFDPGNGAYYFTQDNPNFDVFQWNAFITRFDLTNINVGVSNPTDNVGVQLSVFPNPSSDFVNVKLEGFSSLNTEIVIHNYLGELMKYIQVNHGDNSIQIDISQLANGIYLLSVISGDLIVNTKIVKH